MRPFRNLVRPGMVAALLTAVTLEAALLVIPIAAANERPGVFDLGSWRWAGGDDRLHSLAVFAGEGTERNLSDTLENLVDFEGSTDRVVAVAAGRRIAWFRDQLSLDGEAFYARHYGRERYHEVGLAAYLRWHEFPWSDILVTSFAIGAGPSYTTIYPLLESSEKEEDRSRILNQFNLEITVALPDYRHTSLVTRLQHRSGMFGIINGVRDASNFLTVGLRHEF